VRWQGEARLNDLLDRCRQGKPPALLSDGFPRDYLPRPILPRASAPQNLSKTDRIKHHLNVKFASQSEWLRLDEFNRLRRGEMVVSQLKEKDVEQAAGSRAVSKNRINRLTNTAGGDGGTLFDFVENILPEVSIYWRIEDAWEKTVRDFLEDLKASGYGKRKSVGYGQIESFTLDVFDGFDEIPPQANGFISLSRFVPAPNDPTDGYWDIAVKYGKLGEELAVSGPPFKRPLIQLECGSCFFDEVKPDWVNRWYGQLVDDVAPQRPEVKQYGFAFLAPMRIPEQQ
jgi:CRISPR-associated protein Csm4